MERYSEYKDSGIQWIGEIPSHWKTPTIGRLFDIKAGGDAKPEYYSYEKDEKHPYPVYTNTKDDNSVYAFTSKPFFPAQTITVTGRGDIGRAIYRTIPYDAIIRLLSLCPRIKLNAKFFTYFINVVIPFTSDSAAIGQLSAVQIKPKVVTFPPLPEQDSIVAYLDTQTSRIDSFIANVEREIELLGEAKQKIIADAVTKGLKKDVEMKDSGISWCKKIPTHWEQKRIASIFSSKPENNSDFKFKHAYKFNYGTIVPKNEIGNPDEYREIYEKYSVVKKDDIMINGLNLNYDFISQRVAIVPDDGIITSAYLVMRPKNTIIPMYYCYLFKAMDSMKMFHGMGTGIRLTLSFQEIKKYLVPIPPIEEQQAIVDFISQKTSQIDALISSLSQQITSLKEYKQRLISDVVTGQIKVC